MLVQAMCYVNGYLSQSLVWMVIQAGELWFELNFKRACAAGDLSHYVVWLVI